MNINTQPWNWLKLLVVSILAINTQGVWAQSDKSQYHLFNATPKEQMRELSTDRPDKTESPYTVDAGHFQIETDVIIFTQDKSQDAGVETKTKSFSPMVSNLKVGLTNSIDLQAILSPYQSEETTTTGSPTEKKNGFGDTLIRLKYNICGNDGGDVALGLMPFAKIPTNSDALGNKKVEGGLILPIALSLPRGWSMGLMAQLNRNKNDADDNFHTESISSITAGHDIVGDLAGYLEFFSLSSDEAEASWVATADIGFTYAVTPDLQLDAGANIGLTRSADDLNPFLGVSARF
jgi:hypothetical protein